jgi:hypothetical protein
MRKLSWSASVLGVIGALWLLAPAISAQFRPGVFTLLALTDTTANALVVGGYPGDTSGTGGIKAGPVSLKGHLTFGTDATYDIGASGATRPRDIYNSRNVFTSGSITMLDYGNQVFHAAGTIRSDLGTDANSTLTINDTGFGNGTTRFRDLSIKDGKNTGLALFTNALAADNGAYVNGSVSVGTLTRAGRSTTNSTNAINIYDGTAPVGTTTGNITLYSTAGELRVMDAGGTATLLSPHDPKTGKWIYSAVDSRTGRSLRVDMEDLVKFLDAQFGTHYTRESGPPTPYPGHPPSPPGQTTDPESLLERRIAELERRLRALETAK